MSDVRETLRELVEAADLAKIPELVGIFAEVQAFALARLQSPGEEYIATGEAADLALMARDAFSRLCRTRAARSWARHVTRRHVLVEKRAFQRWLAAGSDRKARASAAIRRADRDECPPMATIQRRERAPRAVGSE